jgi:hypothetical protein
MNRRDTVFEPLPGALRYASEFGLAKTKGPSRLLPDQAEAISMRRLVATQVLSICLLPYLTLLKKN